MFALPTTLLLSIWFLEQVMGNSPRVTAFIGEQLRAGHIKHLPPIVPRGCVLLPIRFDEMRPDIGFVSHHLGEPVLVSI